ncbi:MAG: bifunctional hydroxymethylpyrimidine kinase/phosphomethylpyrimidine kinase [Luteimonas sp.]
MAPDARPPSALTIAGSDSGGGAGIQADLKTFSAHRVHGLSAVTALTAQNTGGVFAVHVPPPAFLRAQIDACFDDFNIAAVKVGMLATAEVIHVVADALDRHRPPWIVLDPVMIATSGARLLEADAVDALRARLLPMASVITPNVPEAEALIDATIRTQDEADAALLRLLHLGCRAVMLKGGHLEEGDKVFDRYVEASSREVFAHRRLLLQAHGTGCSFAAAVAANLCLGHDMAIACRLASDYVARGLQDGYRPGSSDVLVLDHAAARRPENKKAGE